MKKIISLILLGAAIALVGCQLPSSGEPTTTLKKACIITTETESACYYSGDNYDQLEVMTECLKYTGAVSTACPTANVYGKCTVTKEDSGDIYYKVIYNDSSDDAKAVAQTDCEAITGGVWTLGSN